MGEKTIGLALVVTSGLMYSIELGAFRIAYMIEQAADSHRVHDFEPPGLADNWLGYLMLVLGLVSLTIGYHKEQAAK